MKGFLLLGDQSGFEKEMTYVQDLFKKLNFDVDAVNIYDIDVIVSNDYEGKILVKGELVDCPEFVVVGSVRERETYQIKAVLRMFESLGVKCVNTMDAVEKTGDKLYSFQLAKKYVPEVKIPKTIYVNPNTSINTIEQEIGFPLVLKIMYGFQGKGVSLIESKEQLENILNIVFASEFGDEIIAQEAIMSSAGKDIRVVVGAGEAIHSFIRHNEGEFKSNIHQGGFIEKFEAPQKLIDISIKLAEAFDLKLGSIDYLIGENDDEFYLCELNSVPGISYVFEAQDEGNEELVKKFASVPIKILK